MSTCPECNNQIPETTEKCPHCGRQVIPGDTLEQIPTKTTHWQQFIIAISVIILIAIGFTYQHAEERENLAAQTTFYAPLANIVRIAAEHSGLGRQYGIPTLRLKAQTKSAQAYLAFPSGPLSEEQAAVFGQAVCAALARTYVQKGYMPRELMVNVSSRQPTDINYGTAVYNGNRDRLGWQSAK